ncbi:DUF2336 domain-containing protein [Sphingomonas ginsenosidivorax]|uniref:DUF2336 domain-containing protein n=1 Tax=Sphingomonas ginsenosidivorax TaxID=862135 RepID=A0A5C6UBH3_9SPHN|nr:DUF2336 domain-containing protein [Sphingomonas ginsenosidivorax]TXC70079.1 DUF2336 domain-containing protein [Sphingomonas ginsenosidivorax]
MSVGPDLASAPAPLRIDAVSRAELARVRAEARLTATIADFFLDADARLDERTRLRLAHVLDGIVGAIEADIRRHAARLLANAGDPARGEAILKAGASVVARLTRAELLHDGDLMDELIARVRHDLIADALPVAITGPDESSLLVRLASVPDTVVASAANALLAAESRRRTANETDAIARSELPAELHHRLVWWIAAAIREGVPDGSAASDRAIADAALRSLSAHDEGDRPEAVAMRLAGAIDARPEELAALLVEAIGDRRLSLFVAVLAHSVGVEFDQARAITLEPEGDRLWLALRAADVDRPTIARIGLALSDADPRRDVEAFADALDAIAAVPVADAQAALGPLSLHRDFRAAIRALGRSDRR